MIKIIFTILVAVCFTTDAASLPNKANAFSCWACKAGIGAIENALTNGGLGTEQLEKVLLQACDVIPDEADRQVCKIFIQDHLQQVLQDLNNGVLSPARVCQQMGACKARQYSAKELAAETKLLSLYMGDKGLVGDLECNGCEALFGFLTKTLSDPTLQAQVLNTVLNVCRLSNDQQYQDNCMTVMMKYAQVLFQTITSLLDPNAICPSLQLCPTASPMPVNNSTHL